MRLGRAFAALPLAVAAALAYAALDDRHLVGAPVDAPAVQGELTMTPAAVTTPVFVPTPRVPAALSSSEPEFAAPVPVWGETWAYLFDPAGGLPWGLYAEFGQDERETLSDAWKPSPGRFAQHFPGVAWTPARAEWFEDWMGLHLLRHYLAIRPQVEALRVERGVAPTSLEHDLESLADWRSDVGYDIPSGLKRLANLIRG
ncbi:MAG TPA: hypothetical protein VM285_02280 [Polyangia bacterium]|nr:hypothetical protein [Polyangia bacterium]